MLEQEHHYLTRVHRLKVGSEFTLFNSKDGECVYQIEKIDHQFVFCTKVREVKRLEKQQNISIAVPVIKQSRLEWAVEKIAEMGVFSVTLFFCERTLSRNVDLKRLNRIMISAVQQSSRVSVPQLIGPVTLQVLLKQNKNVVLASKGGVQARQLGKSAGKTLLIGPEGGFSESEEAMLEALPSLCIVPDGILRTETAAIAGLAALKQN